MRNRKIFNLLLVGGSSVLLYVAGYFIYEFYLETMMKRNDALATERSELLFNAIESYLASHRGNFPKKKTDLVVNSQTRLPFCGDRMDGYVYECEFGLQTYGINVYPIKLEKTGHRVIKKGKSHSIFVYTDSVNAQKIIKTGDDGRLIETERDYKKSLLPSLEVD